MNDDGAVKPRFSRRQILTRAALVGLSAPAVATLLAACGGGGGGGGAAPSGGGQAAATVAPSGAQATTAPAGTPATLPTGEAANPLAVKAEQPLDVVIFKGGFGDDYAINAEQIYQQAHAGAKVSHQGIQRLQEQLQPRFVGGNPPDAIDNSGAGNLDTAALADQGELADLADLMEAPSFDTPGKKFSETLIPGSQETAAFGGKQFGLQYAYTVYGIWYSESLLKQKGWEYPTTWDKMLSLCEDIKKSGTSPWTYQGKYPQYMLNLMNQLVWKHGGLEAIKSIDNLEPNGWTQPAVKDSAQALYELAARDYIMPGTAGLTHTESQAEWLQGKAVFIPCGTWLENEEKGLVPDNFNMVVRPTPSLGGDKVPFEGVNAYAGETFIVPAKGKNVQGGKEYLRVLFSKQGARFFSQNTKALTVTLGSADGLDLGSAFASAQDVVKKAGNNTFVALYGTWYKKLADDVKDQMGAMLTKQITPEDFVSRAQQLADDTAKDSSIKKYKR